MLHLLHNFSRETMDIVQLLGRQSGASTAERAALCYGVAKLYGYELFRWLDSVGAIDFLI